MYAAGLIITVGVAAQTVATSITGDLFPHIVTLYDKSFLILYAAPLGSGSLDYYICSKKYRFDLPNYTAQPAI
jgi:hypothetical protein